MYFIDKIQEDKEKINVLKQITSQPDINRIQDNNDI